MADISDACMIIIISCVIMALMLGDFCGMVIMPVILYVIALIFTVIAYCNIGNRKSNRKKRKRR